MSSDPEIGDTQFDVNKTELAVVELMKKQKSSVVPSKHHLVHILSPWPLSTQIPLDASGGAVHSHIVSSSVVPHKQGLIT